MVVKILTIAFSGLGLESECFLGGGSSRFHFLDLISLEIEAGEVKNLFSVVSCLVEKKTYYLSSNMYLFWSLYCDFQIDYVYVGTHFSQSNFSMWNLFCVIRYSIKFVKIIVSLNR